MCHSRVGGNPVPGVWTPAFAGVTLQHLFFGLGVTEEDGMDESHNKDFIFHGFRQFL